MKRGLIAILVLLFIVPIAFAQDFSASFNIDKSEVQLGDKFTVSGLVNYNGLPLSEGYALIEFKKDNKIYSTTSQISNGVFSTTTSIGKTPTNEYMPAGAYNVVITVNDGYGNSKVYENTVDLLVNNKLALTLNLNKLEFLPGEKLTLTGIAKRSLDNIEINGKSTITFEDKTYDVDVVKGKFSYESDLASNIKSNLHNIDIFVIDNNGNNLKQQLQYSITPVQTRLENNFNTKSFLPDETLKITSKVYDQAEDLVDDIISIKIYNPKNNPVLEKEIETEKEASFKITMDTIPGEYKVIIESTDLSTEDKFTVQEVKALSIDLENQILTITNVGNTKNKDNLRIIATSKKEYVLEKITNLNPSEAFIIDLSKELPSGTYEINIPDQGKTFKNIEVKSTMNFFSRLQSTLTDMTGAVVLRSGTTTSKRPIIILVLIIIILVALFILINLRTRKKKYKKRQVDVKEGRKAMEKIKEIKLKPSGEKRFRFGKASKSDIEDYKRRILKELEPGKKTRENDEGYSSFDRPLERKREMSFGGSEENNKKGLFGMFK